MEGASFHVAKAHQVAAVLAQLQLKGRDMKKAAYAGADMDSLCVCC